MNEGSFMNQLLRSKFFLMVSLSVVLPAIFIVAVLKPAIEIGKKFGFELAIAYFIFSVGITAAAFLWNPPESQNNIVVTKRPEESWEEEGEEWKKTKELS